MFFKSALKNSTEARVILDTSLGTTTPDMSDARIIIIKEEENTSFPHYIHVSDTEYENGVICALNANGDVIIEMDEKLEIATLDESQTASPKDIKEGSELLCWYDSLTLADPATATPTKVAIINYGMQPQQNTQAPADIKNENTTTDKQN